MVLCCNTSGTKSIKGSARNTLTISFGDCSTTDAQYNANRAVELGRVWCHWKMHSDSLNMYDLNLSATSGSFRRPVLLAWVSTAIYAVYIYTRVSI